MKVEGVFGKIQPIEKGTIKIETYNFDSKKDFLYNVRCREAMYYMYDGDYVRLYVNNQLMMSDTNMERTSNYEFIRYANGDVLIAGLGIGLIIFNILKKDNIKTITIIENNQDLIDVIAPYFKDYPNVKIIHGDIFEWVPDKGIKYDTIYFDIWPDICEDNLDEIKILHNKFKNKINRNNPNYYMNSWLKDYLKGLRRRNR